MPVRERFFVELKDNETTVVSWKKLLKDAERRMSPGQQAASEAPVGANPALEARIAPDVHSPPSIHEMPPNKGSAAGASSEDPLSAPPNRFSSVIEKIERLYKGGDSDDENVEGTFDEDQYDSDDPFIDDEELNEYFTVDKAKTKHTGFFINRGILEKIDETQLPTPVVVPPKRRRQDIRRLSDISGDESAKKRLKNRVRMKDAARRIQYPSTIEHGTFEIFSKFDFGDHTTAKKHGSRPNFDRPHKHKKAKALRELADQSDLVPRVSSSLVEVCVTEFDSLRACMGLDTYEERPRPLLGTSCLQECHNKKGAVREIDNADRLNKVVSSSEYDKIWKDSAVQGHVEATTGEPGAQFSVNEDGTRDSDGIAAKNGSGQLTCSSSPGPKESSPNKRAGWPKGTVLERAIQDLERGVAECCPPAVDGDEPDQAVQLGGSKAKRVPRDVKQRLAKVARLAQAKQGKVPEDLVVRLMGILGHVMRLKTLKRNLKEMVELGLSAKHEKEGRLQDIKREVTELVRSQISSLQAQAAELQEISRDNVQPNPGVAEKVGSGGVKYKWDHATEDRLCDLYEQYVEGMDEHKGPQIRKLYGELAELWPEGWMDNNGIKLAVYRAKERKKQIKKVNKEPRKRQRAGPSSETPAGSGEVCAPDVAVGGPSWATSNEFLPNPAAYHRQPEHAKLASPCSPALSQQSRSDALRGSACR